MLIRLIVLVCALCVLVFGVLTLVLRTEDGRRVLVDAVAWLMAETTGITVSLQGLEPGLPGHIAFDRLTLADADGIWLDAERFALDWRPMALLARRLEIDSFAVGDLGLARLPAASESTVSGEQSGGFAWEPLPVRPVIHSLAMPRLALGEPLLGVPATVSVNASLTPIAADVDRLDFEIVQLDGTANRLSLQGSGTHADWQGRLSIDAPDAANVTASVNLTVGKQVALRLEGEADVAALLPSELRPLAEPVVRAAATFTYSDGERLAISDLRLAVPAATIEGAGSIDLADTALAADLKLTIDGSRLPVSLLGSLSVERATANLVLSGTAELPKAGVEAAIERVALPEMSADRVIVTAHIDPETRDGVAVLAVEGEVAAQAMRMEPDGLQALIGPHPALRFAVAVDTAAGSLRIDQATLDGRFANALMTDAAITADRRATGRLHLRIEDLAGIGTLTGVPLAGAGSAEVEAEGSLAEATATASVSLALSGFQVGEPVLAALLGSTPGASANLRVAGEQRFEVSELAIHGRAVTASGQGVLDAAATSVDAALQIRLPDLAPVLVSVDANGRGEASLDIRLQGSPSQPQVSVDGRMHGNVGQLGVRSARLQLTAENVLAAATGSLNLDGDTSLGSARVSTAFGLESGQRLRLSWIEARTAGVAITGEAVVPLTGGPVEGRLNGQLRALDAPLVVSTLSIGGTADLVAEFLHREGQGLEVAFKGEHLRIAESGVEVASFRSLKAEASLVALLENPRGTFSAVGEALRADPVSVRRVTIDGGGSLDDTSARAVVLDPFGRQGRLETAARLRRDGEDWRIDVTSLRGRLAKRDFTTSAPVSAVVGPRRIGIERFSVRIADGRIDGRGRWSPPEGLDAEMSVDRLPLDFATLFVPGLPIGGEATMQVRVWTADGQVQGDFDVGLRHVRIGEPGAGGVAAGSATATASWRSGMINAKADANLPRVARAEASFSLPLVVDSTRLQVLPTPGRGIAGDIHARASLTCLSALLALDDQRLCGNLAGQLAVGGTLETPTLDGRITMTGARYENFVTGTVLDRGNVEVVLGGDRVATLNLDAADGGKGRLRGEGTIGLPAEGSPSGHLTLSLTEATLIRRDDVTATASGDITYADSLQAGELKGSIETSSIEVRLLDTLPPSVVDLKVVEVGRRDEIEAATPPEAPVAVAAKLDLAIAMPRRIFVRGRGLDAEWGGRFTITGTTNDPVVNGNLGLIRGVYEFAGKRFELTRGNIELFGNGDADARLDIVAEHKARELTATITVSGTASAPQIHLGADRDLPESEILAQVLFNKSSARLGPVEAVQLASALQSLTSGRSMSDDALGFVRTLLGLDTLSVGGGAGEDGGGASVTAGRYIGESVFVGATQSTDTGSQSGTVSIEIAPGLSIESEVGQVQQETTGSVGLRWRWDY